MPRISLTPRPLPPLLTEEEKAKLPEIIRMYNDSLREMPAAVRGMPGAIGTMIKQQLPPAVRAKVDAVTAHTEALRAKLPSVKISVTNAADNDKDA